MARFIILDDTVQTAFHWLDDNCKPAAAARAMRERTADEKKIAKARAFMAATGNVAERDAQSIVSEAYKIACEAEYEAIEADEFFRRHTSKCSAIIEAWRSCQANERAMARVA